MAPHIKSLIINVEKALKHSRCCCKASDTAKNEGSLEIRILKCGNIVKLRGVHVVGTQKDAERRSRRRARTVGRFHENLNYTQTFGRYKNRETIAQVRKPFTTHRSLVYIKTEKLSLKLEGNRMKLIQC